MPKLPDFDWPWAQPQRVDETTQYITARNPSVFTGPGTNTWLVGRERIVVIDPGPTLPEHIQAIVDAVASTGSTIAAIACTHTHMDHSPGVQPLLEALDRAVPIYGSKSVYSRAQDTKFEPTAELIPDQIITDGDVDLKSVHTPGHASNHYCFINQETKMLYSGDHVMQGSTVVIGPPDGDMQHYMDSLDTLRSQELSSIGPAHGYVIDNAYEAIDYLVAHRLKREAKVLAAVNDHTNTDSAKSSKELTPLVYDDVSTSLHGIAASSLLAHLIRLGQHQKITRHGDDLWSRLPT